ncbi:MAG TPA: hypothetical protein VNF51_02905 [Candidatus Paceibacterota bacterium]|nr:hypothetical protein [Candidatus Paceibacterota bacterium]
MRALLVVNLLVFFVQAVAGMHFYGAGFGIAATSVLVFLVTFVVMFVVYIFTGTASIPDGSPIESALTWTVLAAICAAPTVGSISAGSIAFSVIFAVVTASSIIYAAYFLKEIVPGEPLFVRILLVSPGGIGMASCMVGVVNRGLNRFQER